jgi:hypothetical protein
MHASRFGLMTLLYATLDSTPGDKDSVRYASVSIEIPSYDACIANPAERVNACLSLPDDWPETMPPEKLTRHINNNVRKLQVSRDKGFIV